MIFVVHDGNTARVMYCTLLFERQVPLRCLLMPYVQRIAHILEAAVLVAVAISIQQFHSKQLRLSAN